MRTKILYSLGKVKQMIEAVGMGISYAHEDLVFLEHNAFLLRFTDCETEILVHLNIEADHAVIATDLARLQAQAQSAGLACIEGSSYRLTPVDGENIRLEFLEETI